ncbi:hypothetical protein BT96DRAFT_1004787 [Gymnopus androsaceus JB14]|uniref:Uncharacterized protein n=1 Tax=Gymnopus androsaceus JB14 TaxID=1447944 RepID=A0A6A4GR93_9AGAR|nr:hypothetical protein BT96DRAFT_1004787 [Gymnopus androsaceus JB14]
MSEIPPAPLTDSLRLDIILLSSYLCGQQAVSSVPCPDDRDAELYNHVSTLLTTGNSRNTKASNVNVVVGKTNINSVEFLVFAENARLLERDSGRSEPMGERVDVVADKMRRKELLEKWAEDKDSFTFDSHLKDLFNVITSLGNEASLFTFQCFIYRRAYQKVAWRVLEISTHWGTSPFGLIKQCLHQSNLLCKEVDIQLPTQFHQKLQETLELKNHSIPNTDSGDLSIVKYPVNSDNAKSWLSIIYKQWLELEVHLLVDKKATETTQAKKDTRKDVPKAEAIHAIVNAMIKLRSLQPVLDHLLSVEGLHKVLADAEAKQYSLRNSTTLPADKADENNVAESEDSEDHDELNLTQKEVDSAQLYPSYATSRLMSAFKNVLGWQYATTYVYAKASHFRGTLKLSRFYYPHGLEPAVFHPKTVTDVLENKLKLESSIPYNTTRILSTTLNAKVHAEAALMSWITTLDEKESACSIEWPIGVSKKSCRLCWELSSCLKQENRLVFQLPGTHSTFYPWIPPPGISDIILLKLRHVLLNACQSFKATHSRQSSTSSAKDHPLVIDSNNSSWGKAEIPIST